MTFTPRTPETNDSQLQLKLAPLSAKSHWSFSYLKQLSVPITAAILATVGMTGCTDHKSKRPEAMCQDVTNGIMAGQLPPTGSYFVHNFCDFSDEDFYKAVKKDAWYFRERSLLQLPNGAHYLEFAIRELQRQDFRTYAYVDTFYDQPYAEEVLRKDIQYYGEDILYTLRHYDYPVCLKLWDEFQQKNKKHDKKDTKERHELPTDTLDAQIKAKVDVLRALYGLRFMYNKDYSEPGTKVTKASHEDVLIVLEEIQKAFWIYPPEIIKNFKGLKFIIGSSIKEKKETYNGLAWQNEKGRLFVAVNASSGNRDAVALTLHHELFHALDYRKNNLQDDNYRWKKASHSTYVGKKWEKEARSPKGFYNNYGMRDVDEDQATSAEAIITSSAELRNLVARALSDDQLFAKLQMMTSCIIDRSTGRFTGVMTEKEYETSFGFKRRNYYYRWSNGKMDAHYWNALLDAQPMRF